MSKSRKRRKEENPRLRSPRNSHWEILGGVLTALQTYLDPELVTAMQRVIRSRSLDEYLKVSDHWGLQGKPIVEGENVQRVRARYQVVSLLRKLNLPDNKMLLTLEAKQAILSAEDMCSTFNRVGYKSLYEDNGRLAPIYERARVICARILGGFNGDKVLGGSCRHGPGSSTSCSFSESSSYFKYSMWPYPVTARAAVHAKNLIMRDQRWFGALEESYREKYEIPPWAIINWEHFWSSVLEVRNHNKVTFVEKDATKLRPIAIENTPNIMLQLGVDGYVRKRLKRWGIDLDHQDLNQRLAREGTIDVTGYRCATIDLAQASDTVSLRIAKLLLPDEWYRYLCDIRSPCGLVETDESIMTPPAVKAEMRKNGIPDRLEPLRWSKLSSMGNGSTFVVESLIFYALAHAVAERYLGENPKGRIATFGDDLLVPEPCSGHLVRVLTSCGFRINTRKSFCSGPFKESCGTDWYNSNEVRPVFLRQPVVRLTDALSIRNRLNRWFARHFESEDMMAGLDSKIRSWLPEDPLQGPYSDTEFDTYWHSPDSPRSERSVYRYKSVLRICAVMDSKSRDSKIRNISFRKLMHSLQPRPRSNSWISSRWLITNWEEAVDGGVSSRFRVADPVVERYRIVPRVTSNWTREYSDLSAAAALGGRPLPSA